MSAFITVIVRIAKRKTKKLTVAEKIDEKFNFSSGLFFDASFDVEADPHRRIRTPRRNIFPPANYRHVVCVRIFPNEHNTPLHSSLSYKAITRTFDISALFETCMASNIRVC